MENINRKSIRSNKAQIQYLCQYMLQNPAFAAGDYRSPLGATKNNAEWAKLKRALDELGPSRSIEQWKICWRDQKRKARAEAGALRQARTATGNSEPVPILSDNSALVLGAIGQEMAVGFGPDESPIGFSQTMTVSPTNVLTQAGPSDGPAPSQAGLSDDPAPLQTGPSDGLAPSEIESGDPQPVNPNRRVRRALPPERFIEAQMELNNLIKELIGEVRRGNELREAHLNILRGVHTEKRHN